MKEIGIMEVGGFRLGHAQDELAATGCTVLLCDEASPCGVDVRGGGPASRETQLLSPVAHADAIHALATVMFLWFLSEPMLEKLDRVKVKYGLIER